MLELYDKTGAIKIINVGSDGLLQNSNLASLKPTADTIQNSQDELLQLQRERLLLEEKVKILEARRKLGLEP